MSDWQDTRLALEEARAELDRERNENRSNLELVVEIERLRAELAYAKEIINATDRLDAKEIARLRAENEAGESVLQKLRDLRVEDNERLNRFIARYERAEADLEAAREEIARLRAQLDARMSEHGASVVLKLANAEIDRLRERIAPKS